MPVNLPRGRPTLWTAQHDHWPTGARWIAASAGLILDPADFQDTLLQGSRHRLVHALVFTAFHKIRSVTVADEKRLQLLVTDASQHGRIVDFVAIEVQDRKHCTVPRDQGPR